MKPVSIVLQVKNTRTNRIREVRTRSFQLDSVMLLNWFFALNPHYQVMSITEVTA